MSFHLVTLPCKPVVWQYLVNRYGANMAMPEDDWIKILVKSLLYRNTDKEATKISLQYYTKAVGIPINQDEYQRYGYELSKTAVVAINNRIEDVVHQQLYQYLEFYVHVCHYRLNSAIEMFQQEYNFREEVYSADSIKKHYQRKIQPFVKTTAYKFVGVNVPFKKKKKYNRAA